MTTVPRPELGPFTPFEFPEPELARRGDLNVEIYEAAENAIAAVAIVTPSGDRRDPDQLPGLGRIVTEMRGEGTTSLSGAQLRRAMDACGARLFTETSDTHTATAVAVPESLIARASELLALTAREPLYRADDLKRSTRIAIEQLRVDQEMSTFVATSAMAKLHFQAGTRSSFPSAGTEAALKAMTVADLTAFTEQFVLPAGSTLLIALPASEVAAKESILNSFDWSTNVQAPQPLDRLTADYRPIVQIIDRPDSVQTDVLWSVPAVRRTTQEGAALRLAAHLLGGPINSRLSSVLREELGVTYGISAEAADSGSSATLRIGSSVDSERIGEALSALKDTLSLALDEGFHDEEIAEARREIEYAAPLEFENVAGILDERIGMLLHGESIADYRHRNGLLTEVTGESATAQLRAHLDANKPQLVLVGDASELEKAARATFPDVEIRVETR